MIRPERLQKGDKVAIVSLSAGTLGEPKFIHKYYIAKERLEKDFGLEDLILIRYSTLFKHYYNQKLLDPFYKSNDLMNNDFAQLITRVGDMLNIKELNNLDIVNTNLLIKAKEPKKKGFFAGLFGKN